MFRKWSNGINRIGTAAVVVLGLTVTPPVALSLYAQEEVATPVGVDAVIQESLHQTVPVIGRLVATRSGVVAARTSGPVGEFRVQVGDRVAADDVIAKLVSDALESRRELWQSEVRQYSAAVQTSRAEMALSQQELDRLEELEGSSAFSQAQMDDKRQQVAVAKSAVAESRAELSVAEANLMLAEINLYNAEIRAPYDGVVSQRHTEVGAFVTPGMSIVTLIDDKTLEIEADVPTERIDGLTPGTAIMYTLQDGTMGEATVRAVIPDENPLTRTRSVRFSAQLSEDTVLAVNQSATLNIPNAAPRSVTSVHKDAVLNTSGGTIVYVAVDGVASMQPVTLGESVGPRFEVIDGLSVGDLVVVRGNERLRPDQLIEYPGTGS